MGGSSNTGLAPIPVIDLQAGDPVALLHAERDRVEAVIRSARRFFPGPAMALGDAISRRWLERTQNPYRAEIGAVAAALGHSGAWLLNVSYEWACTSGVAPAPGGRGNRLLRVLDWRVQGLGAHVLALRRSGPAGPWLDLNWPGFAGVNQALAPGRFAAALNQAPLRRRSGLLPLDWAAARAATWRNDGLPPAHLLRRAFEQARSYEEAKALLSEAPLALPAIFVLSGPEPAQGCVIERLERRAFVRYAPTASANCWVQVPERARPRGEVSAERRRQMAERQGAAGNDLDWLAPPILNPTTRLAMVAEPATGRLVAQGFEAGHPATAVLSLEAAVA